MANSTDTVPMNLLPMEFISNEAFSQQRSEILKEILALKHSRRVALGPDMTVVFEHPRLIWWHIQEMLRLEHGGAEQLQEEWAVYAPLLPSPDYITLTMMIEIHDPVARKKELRKREGIEHELFLEGAGFRIRSEPIDMGEEQESPNHSLQNQKKDRGKAQEGPGAQAVLGGQNHGDIMGPENGVQDGGQIEPAADQTGGQAADSDVSASKKTSAIHFLRFPLTPWERKNFAMGEPILSCGHPCALYRTPIAIGLWNALCHEIGVVPLKY